MVCCDHACTSRLAVGLTRAAMPRVPLQSSSPEQLQETMLLLADNVNAVLTALGVKHSVPTSSPTKDGVEEKTRLSHSLRALYG